MFRNDHRKVTRVGAHCNITLPAHDGTSRASVNSIWKLIGRICVESEECRPCVPTQSSCRRGETYARKCRGSDTNVLFISTTASLSFACSSAGKTLFSSPTTASTSAINGPVSTGTRLFCQYSNVTHTPIDHAYSTMFMQRNRAKAFVT